VPYNPYNLRNQRWGEALVAAAGPAANMTLAIVFGLLIRFVPLGSTLFEILSYVVLINVVLAIFNLVPIPPLDGSKILFALLPYRYGAVRTFLERYGLIVVMLFILFLWRLIVPLISLVFGLITGHSAF
jgi:Zn-dependent protease